MKCLKLFMKNYKAYLSKKVKKLTQNICYFFKLYYKLLQRNLTISKDIQRIIFNLFFKNN